MHVISIIDHRQCPELGVLDTRFDLRIKIPRLLTIKLPENMTKIMQIQERKKTMLKLAGVGQIMHANTIVL